MILKFHGSILIDIDSLKRTLFVPLRYLFNMKNTRHYDEGGRSLSGDLLNALGPWVAVFGSMGHWEYPTMWGPQTIAKLAYNFKNHGLRYL
jgi:hypothetical protein